MNAMIAYKQLREECYEANLLLPEYKLIDLTFGNVSVCDPDAAIFAIKPSGIDYKRLKPKDMVIVDFEGKVVDGSLHPSSDTPTHLRLFQAFEGIRSIVHTHSRNAVAFAQAGQAIPCLGTTHADYFYGEVPITRPMSNDEIESNYELETGNVIVERFKNLDPMEISGVLVHRHGPFAWGESGMKAVENAHVLEIVAEIALKSIQINPEVKPASQHLLDKHFKRKHGKDAYYGQKISRACVR